MPSISREASPRELCESAALFFALDRNMKIKNISGDSFAFDGKSHGQRARIVDNILSRKKEDITRSLNTAFDGRPSEIYFREESGGQVSHYDLHFLPNIGGGGDSIGCLLIDRSAEETYRSRINARIYEFDIIGQAVRAFGETRNLTEILRIILLAVTAGPGLGFNRAFILLANESDGCLRGCIATGPSSADEAGIIWRSLSKEPLSLDEVLGMYKSSDDMKDIHVNKLISSIIIPLSDDSDVIARAVRNKHPIIIGPEIMQDESNMDFRRKFGVDYMAAVPLYSQESLQGVILADNMITRKPISHSDLKILEILARYASDAIENSRLYSELEQQIGLLKEANEKIIKSRENLVRAERLSSVAKMALDVAHEVRNPLTIIGGYANARLRKISPDDGSRSILELISKQVSRIEAVLNRFSSVVALGEKEEGKIPLEDLIQDTLGILSSQQNLDSPSLRMADDVRKETIFIDKGLFHQALMVILREAARITGGMKNIVLNVERYRDSAMIFITGGDDYAKFAEIFYSGLRTNRGDKRNQEMAVALEILQHYGGDIGIGSSEGLHGRLYVEVPLCREEL
jgi:signal transduction histidine kinase